MDFLKTQKCMKPAKKFNGKLKIFYNGNKSLSESQEFLRQQGQNECLRYMEKGKNVIYKSILPSYSLITCGQIFLVFHI